MGELNTKVMFIFPGQGSQYKGMGSDIYNEFAAARDVYRQAGEVLGYDVAELSFRDPEDKLDTTVHTQPAVLTHSIACLEVFRTLTDGRIRAHVAGGHSLGEYSALVAAGAVSFPDALRLVQKRGELLSRYGRGHMAAFPLDAESLRSVVSGFYCEIGGCNVPDQTVVGGTREDLEALINHVKEHYGVRATPLNVEGAFHTYLMVAAAEQFRPHLDAAGFSPPGFDVLSNYTGRYHPADAYVIKANLFFQIFNPVRWIWGMQHALRDGANMIIEFGGGIGKGEGPGEKRANLAGITKKALKSADRHGIYVPAINSESIKKAAALAGTLRSLFEEHRETDTGAIQYRLYIPVIDGMVTDNSIAVLEAADRSGESGTLRVVAQPADLNLLDIQSFSDDADCKVQPYLKKISGGAASNYLGAALLDELSGVIRG